MQGGSTRAGRAGRVVAVVDFVSKVSETSRRRIRSWALFSRTRSFIHPLRLVAPPSVTNHVGSVCPRTLRRLRRPRRLPPAAAVVLFPRPHRLDGAPDRLADVRRIRHGILEVLHRQRAEPDAREPLRGERRRVLAPASLGEPAGERPVPVDDATPVAPTASLPASLPAFLLAAGLVPRGVPPSRFLVRSLSVSRPRLLPPRTPWPPPPRALLQRRPELVIVHARPAPLHHVRLRRPGPRRPAAAAAGFREPGSTRRSRGSAWTRASFDTRHPQRAPVAAAARGDALRARRRVVRRLDEPSHRRRRLGIGASARTCSSLIGSRMFASASSAAARFVEPPRTPPRRCPRGIGPGGRGARVPAPGSSRGGRPPRGGSNGADPENPGKPRFARAAALVFAAASLLAAFGLNPRSALHRSAEASTPSTARTASASIRARVVVAAREAQVQLVFAVVTPHTSSPPSFRAARVENFLGEDLFERGEDAGESRVAGGGGDGIVPRAALDPAAARLLPAPLQSSRIDFSPPEPATRNGVPRAHVPARPIAPARGFHPGGLGLLALEPFLVSCLASRLGPSRPRALFAGRLFAVAIWTRRRRRRPSSSSSPSSRTCPRRRPSRRRTLSFSSGRGAPSRRTPRRPPPPPPRAAEAPAAVAASRRRRRRQLRRPLLRPRRIDPVAVAFGRGTDARGRGGDDGGGARDGRLAPILYPTLNTSSGGSAQPRAPPTISPPRYVSSAPTPRGPSRRRASSGSRVVARGSFA